MRRHRGVLRASSYESSRKFLSLVMTCSNSQLAVSIKSRHATTGPLYFSLILYRNDAGCRWLALLVVLCFSRNASDGTRFPRVTTKPRSSPIPPCRPNIGRLNCLTTPGVSLGTWDDIQPASSAQLTLFLAGTGVVLCDDDGEM